MKRGMEQDYNAENPLKKGEMKKRASTGSSLMINKVCKSCFIINHYAFPSS